MTRSILQLVRSASLAGLFALSTAGCYVETGPAPVNQPAPPTGQEEVVEAPPAPPPPETEVVPAPPGPEYVWVSGYHRWSGRGYVWTRGRYERRPRANARYTAAHWEARGRGHVWVEGRWD